MATCIKAVDAKFLIGPSAANVRADVAAGPRKDRHWRHYRQRRWWRTPYAEISSMGRRTGQERETGNTGEQNFLHVGPSFSWVRLPGYNLAKAPNRWTDPDTFAAARCTSATPCYQRCRVKSAAGETAKVRQRR